MKDMNISDSMYTKMVHGYTITATEAQCNYQALVAVFYQADSKQFIEEG
jgi:hypothetical protein